MKFGQWYVRYRFGRKYSIDRFFHRCSTLTTLSQGVSSQVLQPLGCIAFHDNIARKLSSQTITTHGSYNMGLPKNVKIFCHLSI